MKMNDIFDKYMYRPCHLSLKLFGTKMTGHILNKYIIHYHVNLYIYSEAIVYL